jgi:hypothetical protein
MNRPLHGDVCKQTSPRDWRGSSDGLGMRHDVTNEGCGAEPAGNDRTRIRRRLGIVCGKALLRRWIEWLSRAEALEQRQKQIATQRPIARRATL